MGGSLAPSLWAYAGRPRWANNDSDALAALSVSVFSHVRMPGVDGFRMECHRRMNVDVVGCPRWANTEGQR